jgi:signal transduction histidine kinase
VHRCGSTDGLRLAFISRRPAFQYADSVGSRAWHACIMRFVRIGTRLTFVLLLALTPVLAAYTYWSVQRSTRTYVNDLKRETRAITRGLTPALENDLQRNEWDQIENIFQRIDTDGTVSALFARDGTSRFAMRDFPPGLAPARATFELAHSRGFVEYERTTSGRTWFCRVVPLLGTQSHQSFGYLLVGQDWTDISEDLKFRTIVSAIAALSLIAAIALTIPLAIRRYVSRPLAELSRKVMRFSGEDEPDRGIGGDEVRMLTEEFSRLDDQLANARNDLLEKYRRELELERRLQHADRLATIGTLASGLAHEIGTPMGVIRARAEYLRHSKPAPAKVQEGLEIIINQIDRISRIVRMLLDYASTRESLRVASDVRPIVEHALKLIETEAARRNVQVVTDLETEPLVLQCNADQLQQVFVNVAMNALDAMALTGGTLRVWARIMGNGSASRLVLTFEDTGPGIPPEHQTQVFDPFFTTKEPGKGTGMGLAVSQSIIRDHNGEITLESRPSGTRFVVAMPIARPVVQTKLSHEPTAHRTEIKN